jgi:hypothetical protein
MANNSDGSRPSAKYNLKQNMAAYDRLPKKVRLALMYADHNWSAGHVRYAMTSKRYRYTSDKLIDVIRQNDANLRQKLGDE